MSTGSDAAAATAQANDGHLCAALDCAARVPLEFLMCRRHWWMVPPAIRSRVWRTYRAKGAASPLTRGIQAAYQEAVRAAVEAVALREKKKLAPEGA